MTVLKNVHFIDGRIGELAFHEGVWQKDSTSSDSITLADDCFVSTGWIDLHTHCFKKYEKYSDEIDTIGYKMGVTCVVDAGTSGSDTIAEFYEQARHAKTNSYAFLNISRTGIKAQNELANLANIDAQLIQDTVAQYPDFIVGLKARMSKSVLQGNGNEPLEIARAAADTLKLPIMVHIGNEPALLEDVFTRLRKGDIVTHIFNPKANGILDAQGEIKECVWEAKRKGIFFDLGHGSESFAFATCEKALQKGLLCDSISTDIYAHNRIAGPVYSLAHTMSKMLTCGYTLAQVVERVTILPAMHMGRLNMASFATGDLANATIFRVVDHGCTGKDAVGSTRTLSKVIEVVAVVLNGEYISL